MVKEINNFRIQLLILLLLQIAMITFFFFINKLIAIVILSSLIIQILVFLFLFFKLQVQKEYSIKTINNFFDDDIEQALIKGNIGLLSFDQQENILWMNDYMMEKYRSFLGKKIFHLSIELEDLINRVHKESKITINNATYRVFKSRKSNIILFQDISDYQSLKSRVDDEQAVLGLITIDNYNEINLIRDESKISLLDFNIRQPIINYANENKFLIKKLSMDKYQLIGRYKDLKAMIDDDFSLLKIFNQLMDEYKVNLALSMVFAYGNSDLNLLDEQSSELIDIVYTRGGNQVAIKDLSNDQITYYGNASPSEQVNSRVRVRIMMDNLRDNIMAADNIYVVGHKIADFDCLGSALAVAAYAKYLNKTAYVISESGGIEPKLNSLFNFYRSENLLDYHFIDENYALNNISNKDLVIVVDHNNPLVSSSANLLEKTKKIIIIDHHRRGEKFIKHAIMAYIEPSASSTCELMMELLSFIDGFEIDETLATLMYGGILVDTDNFKNRTGARTFEAAAMIKKIGFNQDTLFHFLANDLAEFNLMQKIYSKMKVYDNYAIAAIEDTVINRTIISKAADEMVKIQEIDAVFVLGSLSNGDVAVSARSKNDFNVQLVMEKIGGGGHFNAAACVKSKKTVKEIVGEIKQILEEK